ncbi:MAG: hypothetical protein GY803_23555 [Chloroflexi bacterium]|nr:hypothetical protein [Chloroflexota bacterium]
MKRLNWHSSGSIPATNYKIPFLAGFALLLIALLSLTEPLSTAPGMAPVPVFSHPSGYYEQDFLLDINAPPEATIVFTLDGRIPTETTGSVYTEPIRLSRETAVTVIRARAIVPGIAPSPVMTATYFLGLQSTLPILSLVVAPDDLWDPQTGIWANPLRRGSEWERPAIVTYVEKDRISGFQAPAGARIHGASSRNSEKKAWRLYFRQEYGLSQLTYPLFADSQTSFKRLVIHNGGQDARQPDWTMLRAHLLSDLAEESGGFVSQTQPVLLFVNGQSEGIYLLRHRMDERFFANRYGIEILPEEEAERRWEQLVQFVETHDLNAPANYAYVASQVDLANFIDYIILQTYAANTDWIFTNMRQFRPNAPGSRWQWLFWDMDWTFGLVSWSGPEFDMMTWLETNDHRTNFARNSLLIRKLWRNPDFQQTFLKRADELLNTTLAAEKVATQVEALAAELRPDIDYEIGRWPSSGEWEAGVAFMREFAERRPYHFRQHLVNYFGLSGTAVLQTASPTIGAGRVALNDGIPPSGRMNEYFVGTTATVTAVPDPGYRFAGWEEANLPQRSEFDWTVTTAQTFTPRFEKTPDAAVHPNDVTIERIVVDNGDVHAQYAIEGDWFELRVNRSGGIDLRGWLMTDNDGKTAVDEGWLIFDDSKALSHVPDGTTILIIATPTPGNDAQFSQDDLTAGDGSMLLYAGNDNLNASGWFNLGQDDNLALLTPQRQGVAFAAIGFSAVTPFSFGILADGITSD